LVFFAIFFFASLNLSKVGVIERLWTFDIRRPFKDVRATPKQMCKAGYYYSGETDKVFCFYCGTGVEN